MSIQIDLTAYAGVWAIEERAGRQLADIALRLDLPAHLAAVSDPTSAVAVSVSERSRKEYPVSSDGIAILELSGSLMKSVSSFSSNTSTVVARRRVRAMKDDPEVAAVLMLIDSPGGTVAGTADLADDIRALAAVKPVVAYIEDCGCSAAYWLATSATEILINGSGIAGSIGVFMVAYDLSRAADEQGVTVHVVKTGPLKGAGAPGSEITEEHLAAWQTIVDGHFADFVDQVSTGRKMSRDAVMSVATGGVWKGAEAVSVGLVDGVSTLDGAMERARELSSAKNKGKRTMTVKEDGADRVAATVAELESACVGATADFLIGCVKKGATIEEAKSDWIAEQSRANAEMRARLTERGTKPLGDVATDETDDTDGGDFGARVRDFIAANPGATWRAGCQAVAKRFPALHKAFLQSLPKARETSQS